MKFAIISYPLDEASVLSEFRERHKQSVKVNWKWLCIKMKKHVVVFGVLLLARYCLTAYMLPDSHTTTSTRAPTAY